MSIADSAWLLNVELLASLGLRVLLELVFAVLALTLIRARRPRGGLLLFAAVLVGLMLTCVTTLAYPIAFKVVDTLFGYEHILWVQIGLNVMSTVAAAAARLMEVGAVVAVALDPGPVGEGDEPPPL